MRLGWLKAVVLVVVVIMLPIAAGQVQAQEAQGEQPEDCPFEEGWKPENLPRILEEHRKWAARWEENQQSAEWAKNHPEGRANLCNADLGGVNLSKAVLSKANLAGASLFRAKLAEANLTGASLFRAKLAEANLFAADLAEASLSMANLSKAFLLVANLTEANLRWANLTDADLSGAHLTEADLSGANLSKASLHSAYLNKANLVGADLTEAYLGGADEIDADLGGADLTDADLFRANLSKAHLLDADLTDTNLSGAKLSKADLFGANLSKAKLHGTDLTEASLAFANLTNAVYAPASPPPDPYLEGITGLSTVQFPEGSGSGLVQLRELLQKAGLRDLEREATYALESNKTSHLITGEHKSPLDFLEDFLEGIFRLAAFEWTTGYGLYPGRALLIIFGVGVLLIPVYVWPIRVSPRSLNRISGIYQIWPSDRIAFCGDELAIDNKTQVERLQGSIPQALGYAAYFSLLSAFHIGWRDLSIGTWITRAQPREYTLKPAGWVRLVSGLQSLLSVYLLAIWALTYFGRPFQ